MKGKNRNSIADCLKLPQFTTMNVIDGQAGLVLYSSLIFYSLTINNILNIIILIILAGISINMILGNEGLLNKAKYAKESYSNAQNKEELEISKMSNDIDNILGTRSSSSKIELLWEASENGLREANLNSTGKNINDYDLIIVEWNCFGYGFTITFNKFSPSTLRTCYNTGYYLVSDFTFNKSENRITMSCISNDDGWKSTTNVYLTRIVGVIL